MLLSVTEQIMKLARDSKISETCLKAVYFRGVQSFIDDRIESGLASMHGLSRVQQFVADPNTSSDSDLLSTPASDISMPDGITFDIESDMVLFSVIYGNGSDVARLFEPGKTTSITCDSEFITVAGFMDTWTWDYRLSIATGDAHLSVQ